MAVTLYIAVFVAEGSHSTPSSNEETPYTLKQVFIILKDVVKNPYIQLYFTFRCALMGTILINSNLGSVYLTNDVRLPFLTIEAQISG